MTKMIARRLQSPRHGLCWTLNHVITRADGSLFVAEFARIRNEAVAGWRARCMDEADEDLEHALNAALYPVRNGTLREALAAARAGAEANERDRNGHELERNDDEAAYEEFVRGFGDASGPGQHWDANGSRHCG